MFGIQILLKLLMIFLSSASCMSSLSAQFIMDRTIKPHFTVRSVSNSTLPEFCRVETEEGETFFIDRDGRFVIEGIVVKVPELKFSPEEVKRLDRLTAFTVGSFKDFVYVVADPACKVCRSSSLLVRKFLTNRISLRFVLVSFLHGGKGFHSAVSIICDTKGYGEFLRGYSSTNMCDSGKLKVWSSTDMMRLKGIESVPVFILPDGKVFMGKNSVPEVIKYYLGRRSRVEKSIYFKKNHGDRYNSRYKY